MTAVVVDRDEDEQLDWATPSDWAGFLLAEARSSRCGIMNRWSGCVPSTSSGDRVTLTLIGHDDLRFTPRGRSRIIWRSR